ncbi:oligosaccharyl transferase glycoprotein complex, beta subunit [Malassezia psittaci]|uniref:Dolichyl-diphosphooligosaccharide--protein glycosyltransferase subunit WBP1 n=1 Tax=Malassezia psittaci TaxID=1821823 RepID=A0AAF0FB96_9BASI|nr:oligosaccharyl transferase glycoprotein complex, beta subunit [Malassezia psittaci]
MWLRAWLGCLLVVLSGVLAGATGDRLLVVVDQEVDKYSSFLESLDRSGYVVTTRDSSQVKSHASLFELGERAYDHLVLLVPEMKKLQEGLSPQSLVDFAEKGGNLLVGLSPRLSEAWRDFAREFSLEFAERDTMLVDHFGYDRKQDRGDHTAVLVGGKRADFDAGGASNPQVFRESTLNALQSQPFVFRGLAHWIGPNPLAFALLSPPATAYESEVPTITQVDGRYHLSGISNLEPLSDVQNLLTGFDASSTDAQAALASAIQLRANSARVVFLGSVEMLQNHLFGDPTRDVQRAVVEDIVAWTFQHSGVLRLHSSKHYRMRANDADNRPDYEEEVGVATKMYRIKDHVHYILELQQLQGDDWVAAPTDLDLQLAVTMLDPYITLPLRAHVDGSFARYEGQLRLPDRHGVFTLRVNWKRHGWSYILAEDTIPVRPYNHDEYPRMLSSSWPYLAGAFSTMLGFAVFTYLWMALPVEKLNRKKE